MSATTSFVDLLRHGQTEGGSGFTGSTDDRLTPLGMAQMWAAVAGKGAWGGIVASSLRRCAEFASALGEQLYAPVEIDERLREIHFGAWEGQTAEQIARRDPEALQRFWADPTHCPPPGAEALDAFQARVLAAWSDQLQKHPGKRLLLVTHGGPIRVILGHVYRVEWPTLLSLDLPHASLTRLRVEHAADRAARVGIVATIGASC